MAAGNAHARIQALPPAPGAPLIATAGRLSAAAPVARITRVAGPSTASGTAFAARARRSRRHWRG
jgi:hypothetical protein